MRADRLVSIVLLLRQRGRQSAAQLASELDVSTRTVLRDIEALSRAGVPVYVERGRHGGFALLPGFRTELLGLNPDESIALLAAGGARGSALFGFGPALASAMRKLVDAVPEGQRQAAVDAADRILIDPEADLLSRRRVAEVLPDDVVSSIRLAVLDGRKLRLTYRAADRDAVSRTVDPLGLVTVREKGYLLALVDGADRTYRLSRIEAADVLDEAADRPASIDLEQIWNQRSSRFRASGDSVVVSLRTDPARREEIASTAVAIETERIDEDRLLRLTVIFQDLRHAEWALWQLGTAADVESPAELRLALRERAMAVAAHYAD